MALKYIGGTLPGWGVYAITSGFITRVPSGSWELNSETVASVEIAGAGKEYNYAAGGAGMLAGAALAGPVGMVVGGLLPKAFKDDVVQFVIRFRDGGVAHFSGTPADYKRALKSSYKPTLATTRPAVGTDEETKSELKRLREEVAALRGKQSTTSAASSKSVPLVEEPPAPALVAEETNPAQTPTSVPVRIEVSPDEQPPIPDRASVQEEPANVWFEGVPECIVIPPGANEEPQARAAREAQNKVHRKNYLAALKARRKELEKEIRKSTLNPVKRVQMISELHAEYYALRDG